MKKFLVLGLILFGFFSILKADSSDDLTDTEISRLILNSYNSYVYNEKDMYFFGLPVLTLDEDRSNSVILPSVMDYYKKGFAYIDLNGFQGGVIFPSSSKKWMYQIFYTIANDIDARDPSEFFEIDNLPKIQSIIGVGVSHHFSDKLSAGINVSYSWADKSKEKKENGDIVEKNDYSAKRIQINPSISSKSKSYTLDIGGIFVHQWVDWDLKNIKKEDRPQNDYSGHNRFLLYSRFIRKMTGFSKISLGSSIGYIPYKYKCYAESDSDCVNIDGSVFLFSLKAGLLVNPISSLKISSYASYFYSDFYDKGAKESIIETVKEESVYLEYLILGSFAVFSPFKHLYFKSGITKEIIIVSSLDKNKESHSSSEISSSVAFDKPLLNYYFGIGYKYQNFKAETIINSNVFEKGNYLISGRFMDIPPVLLATLEYSW